MNIDNQNLQNIVNEEIQKGAIRQYQTFKEKFNYDVNNKTIEVNGQTKPYSFIIGSNNKTFTENSDTFTEKVINNNKNKDTKSNDDESIVIVPYTSVGRIKFSMDKGNVQNILGKSLGKPKKYSDRYENFIVYYDKMGVVDSVEYWDGNVKLLGFNIFDAKYPEIKKAVSTKDNQAIITKTSITSKLLGVIIKANGIKCKSIEIVRKDYFDPE